MILGTELRLITRYSETDQMGIIHHSSYPIWFEAGRTDLFCKSGISIRRMEEDEGILLPLSHMECTFKSPAKFEDELIIRTTVHHLSCARVEFGYEVVRAFDSRLMAIGKTVHAFTDRNLHPLNLRKRSPRIYAVLSSELSGAGVNP